MKKRIVSVLAATGIVLAGGGVAAADTTNLFVDIENPVDQTVYEQGDAVALDGTVGAGSGAEAQWNVVFLVDKSGSTRTMVTSADGIEKNVFDWEKDGVRSLIGSLQGSNDPVNMGVSFFGSDVTELVFTSDFDEAEKQLDAVSQPSGGTRCDLALQSALDGLANKVGEKRVYLITDGVCNNSADTQAKADEFAKQGVELYTIQTTTGSEKCEQGAYGLDCVYVEDPSTLQANLKDLANRVQSLKVTVTDANGDTVAAQDLSGDLSGAITQNWVADELMGLPAGKYTVTAVAQDKDGNEAKDVTQFIVKAPEVVEEVAEDEREEDNQDQVKARPGLPETGF